MATKSGIFNRLSLYRTGIGPYLPTIHKYTNIAGIKTDETMANIYWVRNIWIKL